MAAEAYKVLQDTSIPKALALISEDEIKGKLYETEGRSYEAGGYVLRSDITPTFHEAIDNGEFDAVLEEVSLDEALEALNAVEVSTFVPEHAVEHLALAQAGHKVVDRETVLELRSAGADDARRVQEEAKEDGADDRPNLSLTESVDLNSDEVSSVRVKDSDESYVDAEAASEAQVQTTPSGVVATNPYVEKAAAKAEESSSSRSRRRPRAAQDQTPSEGQE